MKGLIWGIYGNLNGVDYSANISAFALKGKRKLVHYDLGKLHLFTYEGSTGFQIIDIPSYFIILTGGTSFTLTELDSEKNTHQALTDYLKQVNGLFTLCIYDKKEDTLFLANDFFGLYPLFYHKSDNYLMFCNEYEPLVNQQGKRLALLYSAIRSYFEYGFTLHGTTLFKEIAKFKERQLLEYSEAKIKISTYAPSVKINYAPYDEHVDLLYQALKKSVEKTFNTVDHPIITITGGLDTRMILALTDDNIRKNGEYITFYLPPLNETNDKDVLIAKAIAERFNLNHKIIPFEEKTSNLHHSHFEEIRNDDERPKVTGQFGGELLSGILYTQILSPKTIKKVDSLFSYFSDQSLKKEWSNQGKRFFYLNALASSFFTSIYGGTEGSWMHPWMNSLRYFSPFSDTEFMKVWSSIPDEHLFHPHKSMYFDLYTKYWEDFKKIPTNSMLSELSPNGFEYFKEGVEPKEEKRNKSTILINKIQTFEGYTTLPKKYKSEKYLTDKNQQQRLIDFCVWYEYYLKLSETQ